MASRMELANYLELPLPKMIQHDLLHLFSVEGEKKSTAGSALWSQQLVRSSSSCGL